MDLEDVTRSTPKLLKHCLEVQNSPEPTITTQRKYRSAPVTPAKYENHPDITFFRLVKAKHHYAYHKSKKAVSNHERISKLNTAKTGFNPYSRDLLQERLRTYTSLNWQVPEGGNDDQKKLTELLCASHGWVCKNVTRGFFKNNLKCTGCGSQITLRFNTEGEQPQFSPLHLDLQDIHKVNLNLKSHYIKQIQSKGHCSSCPWKKISTPHNSVYYMMPYLDSTNEAMISSYLSCLKSAINNLPVIKELQPKFPSLYPDYPEETFAQFKRLSNAWLMSKYFSDNKENIFSVLERDCPDYIYWLAVMGWTLETQVFKDLFVGILVCSSCNQRIFINNSTALFFRLKSGYCDKSWCSQVSVMAGQPYHEYFIRMMLNLEPNMGAHGEFLPTEDISKALEGTETESRKRPNFDIADGLDRLTKLRKLYFVD